MAKPDPKDRYRIAADNRRARFDFEITETIEAGIMLTGTENQVPAQWQGVDHRELCRSAGRGTVPVQRQYPEYLEANRFNHTPKRPRKLLLHRRQIDKWIGATQRQGYTVVPMKIYFNEKGRAKIELGLGRGKKLHDKRETDKQRDWNRDKQRIMRESRLEAAGAGAPPAEAGGASSRIRPWRNAPRPCSSSPCSTTTGDNPPGVLVLEIIACSQTSQPITTALTPSFQRRVLIRRVDDGELAVLVDHHHPSPSRTGPCPCA